MAGDHKVIGKPQLCYGHCQRKFTPTSTKEFPINLIVDLYITLKTRQRSVSDLVKEQVGQEGASTHPCLSPLRMSKGAVNVSLTRTTAFMLSCSLQMCH